MKRLPERVAFYTDASAWGGAEVYLSNLMEGVRRAGIEPFLFCAGRRDIDGWIDDLSRRGVTVRRFTPTREIDRSGFDEALKLFAGFEVVHFNKTNPRTCLPAIPAARRAGARAVLATEHIVLPPASHYPFGTQFLTFLIRRTNRYIDRLISVSGTSRRMLLANYRIDPLKVVTIRNGIDLSRFEHPRPSSQMRAELGLKPDAPVIIMIGRLHEGKGHDTALAALSIMASRLPELRLLLVGDGPMRAEIEERARSDGLAEATVFTGSRRDVPDLLALSDLLLLPSDAESLPLVVLEAMAAGLPVVASDVGGISEAVEDGVTGYLVRPRDPDGLARAVLGILGNSDVARRMGKAGRSKVATTFNLTTCVDSVVTLYSDLLTEGIRA